MVQQRQRRHQANRPGSRTSKCYDAVGVAHRYRVNSFVNLSGMWCGCLMQEHRLLANPFTGDIIISLRFQSPGVLGSKVEENQDGYYSLCPRHLAAGSTARKFTLRTLQRSTKMVWESGSHGQFAPETIRALLFFGLPHPETKVCVSSMKKISHTYTTTGAAKVCRANTKFQDMDLLQRKGPALGLTKFFLKYGNIETVTAEDLKNIIFLFDLKVPKFAEATVGKKTRLILGPIQYRLFWKDGTQTKQTCKDHVASTNHTSFEEMSPGPLLPRFARN